jgi:hypothetical protein
MISALLFAGTVRVRARAEGVRTAGSLHCYDFVKVGVDIASGGGLYTPNTAPPPPRCDGAPPKFLTDTLGEHLSDFGRRGGFRRSPGDPEKGPFAVPGCLTGESEERETWTAESLRAAWQ